jgi:hypothetical protein
MACRRRSDQPAAAPGRRRCWPRGNTQRHAELVTSRARNVINGCGFKAWSELSASKVQNYFADLRQDRKDKDGNITRGIGAQTSNSSPPESPSHRCQSSGPSERNRRS